MPAEEVDNPLRVDRAADIHKDEFLLVRPTERWDIKRNGKMRDAECVRLKALGWTLDDIAKHLELDQPNPGNARDRVAAAIRRSLGTMARFAADEMRLVELQSLDEVEWKAWELLQKAHVVVNQGRVVVHADTGEPVEDDRFVLETLDRILKIKERRAKMMGLDAPVRREVITMDSIDEEIAKLEREVAANRAVEVAQQIK